MLLAPLLPPLLALSPSSPPLVLPVLLPGLVLSEALALPSSSLPFACAGVWPGCPLVDALLSDRLFSLSSGPGSLSGGFPAATQFVCSLAVNAGK
jgi:hypothetical protein